MGILSGEVERGSAEDKWSPSGAWWIRVVEAEDEKLDAKLAAHRAAKHLSSKQSEVLALRFGQDETREQIGKRLGISGSRVQQIEYAALRELRVVHIPAARRYTGHPHYQAPVPKVLVRARCKKCEEVINLSEKRFKDLQADPHASFGGSYGPGSWHMNSRTHRGCEGVYGFVKHEEER